MLNPESGEFFADRYQVIQKIGEGSMRTVYEGIDTWIDRRVAIQILLPYAAEDQTFVDRFLKETQISAQLQHPAIVPVYDFGHLNNQLYRITRLMNGGSLHDRLKKVHRMQPEEVYQIIERIGDALDVMHQIGLIHRNIEPSNILFDELGNAYLSDFAIALPVNTETYVGVSLGSVEYTSPEEVQGGKTDTRTDIYQLGVVIYEMLTGHPPFRGDQMNIFLQHIQEKPPAIHEIVPELLPEYDAVIQKALAKQPEDRYATVKEMSQALFIALQAAVEVNLVRPVENPFVVGNPVVGELFVGRTEIFSRLKEIWGSETKRNVNSVVLFGHRRMGKTSILQNLTAFIGEESLVAQFTMQRVGRVRSTGELLEYLALAIYDTLDDAGIDSISEPDSSDFQERGYQAFNRFLREVKKVFNRNRPHGKSSSNQGFLSRLFARNTEPEPDTHATYRRLILTIDEFELIENAIEDGRVDAEFLDFLRGVIHSEHWLILALAGLHTLEEMTADYWNPLFASVTPIRVSFFSRTATGNLLANPVDGFSLTFSNAAVDQIYALTHGQPYLVQLIAYRMVRAFNQQVSAGQQNLSQNFSSEDVNQVVDTSDFYDQGSYYFNGVWGQTAHSGPSGQTAILRSMAAAEGELTRQALLDATGLTEATFSHSMERLRQHDVIRKTESGRYEFMVPLMGRWVRNTQLD